MGDPLTTGRQPSAAAVLPTATGDSAVTPAADCRPVVSPTLHIQCPGCRQFLDATGAVLPAVPHIHECDSITHRFCALCIRWERIRAAAELNPHRQQLARAPLPGQRHNARFGIEQSLPKGDRE